VSYVVEYLKTVTPYKAGDRIPIMRQDRAEALVCAGIAAAVGWECSGPVVPPKTLEEIDPEGVTVQVMTDTGSKAPDAPLRDKQIKQGWRSPVKPIRK
jgi:hypothetical protein